MTLHISMMKKFHSADDITIHTVNPETDGSIFVYRDSFGINLHPLFGTELRQCLLFPEYALQFDSGYGRTA